MNVKYGLKRLFAALIHEHSTTQQCSEKVCFNHGKDEYFTTLWNC